MKQLLKDSRFYKSKTAAEIREEYIDKSNPVLSFVSKCLKVDPGSFERKDDVYSIFIHFCRIRKLPDVSKQRFGSLLPRYAQVREEKKRLSGSRIRCWQGIRFATEDEIRRALSLGEQMDDSVIGDSRGEYNQDEQECSLMDSSKEETQVYLEIKRVALTYLSSSGIVVPLEELIDEVHKETQYSVECVREYIDRLVKGKWIKKDGPFVTSFFDSSPA